MEKKNLVTVYRREFTSEGLLAEKANVFEGATYRAYQHGWLEVVRNGEGIAVFKDFSYVTVE